MRERAADVARLLARRPLHFYVCGLKGMEEGVAEAFRDVCRQRGLDWDALLPDLLREGPLSPRNVLTEHARSPMKFAEFHAGQVIDCGPATLTEAADPRLRARLRSAVVPHRSRARGRQPVEGPDRQRLADLRRRACASL